MVTLPPELERWLALSWDAVVVHFHEIALKGGNRRPFTRALQFNLQRVLAPLSAGVQDCFDRLLVVPVSGAPTTAWLKETLSAAAQVFGVAYAAPVRILPRDMDALIAAAVETYRTVADAGATFAVQVRRVDKNFPLTSQQVERIIGEHIVAATRAPVDLKAPAVALRFRIYTDCAYLVGPKVPGVGGLPVGVTGRVLTLLSGGIDSAVAAWLIMRRGCVTDFLHFHAFPSADEVRTSKIVALVERLVKPQGVRARLLLVPYHAFQVALLMAKVPAALELVLFRRFMVKVACRIAQTRWYHALVTGDNLGQVASQTLENLRALDDAASVPVFRPLLTYDKAEIIALAQRIGTYDLSLLPYKDCCSLIARHPETRPKLDAVRGAEARLPVDALVERTLSELVVWQIG
ncbi:putative tRNA sulfurtransferase [bacterium HR17]|uniref:Probable tRNA sulfurtransferase n=1 Tax=Candidatus Fervidibacter japonicus TaxID=2035412 RepID=A0A2H5XF91_9BACT|nr:putative tRNA sulfurtransferase [bacterium HR17]